MTIAVVLGVAATGSAVAAADRPGASAAAYWLARQLSPDGTLENPLGSPLPDHGLMIDTLLALHASGNGALATPIVTYLDDAGHASDYYTWDGYAPGEGYDAIVVGGAAAKTLLAAEVSGRDPRHFDGVDLVAETKAAIMRSGPDRGRVSDYAKKPEFADFISNNANTFGQALAVIALAAVGENDQLAIDRLVTQQCAEGYFRIFYEYIPTDETGDHVNQGGHKVSTCDEGKPFDKAPKDGDSTGLGLSAMVAARKAGAAGLDGPIDSAVRWLKANQDPGGGWGGGVGTEAPNTNSTGLIVQALAEAGGAEAHVDAGVAYLRSAQATPERDAATLLSEDIGAIGYSPDHYTAAQADGLGAVDTWIRAGAQASLGLAQVGFFDLAGGRVPPAEPPTTAPPATTPPAPVREETPARTTPPPPPAAPRVRGTVVVPPVNLAEPGPDTPAGKLGGYLAGTLVGGDHVEVTEDGRTFVDYDATAELVLALRALDEQPQAVARATDFLLRPESVDAYAHGVPYETGPAAYAEPLAKLHVLARFRLADGDGPADLAPTAERLRTDLAALSTGTGEFVDTGSFADTDRGVERHAWALLAGAGGPDAVHLLVDRQCRDGLFPANLAAGSCATGDPAATAAALSALNSAPADDRPEDAKSLDRQPVAGEPAGGDPEDETPAGLDPRDGQPTDEKPTDEKPAGEQPADGKPSGGQPVAAGEPSDVVPASWSPDRAEALTAAAAALATRTGPDGLVAGGDAGADLALSAVVASGRLAVGEDVSATARALGERLLPGGGLPDAGGSADLGTSVAAAPAVAGRSWTAAAGSPVTAAVRLPLAALPADRIAGDAVRPGAAIRIAAPPVWPYSALGGLVLAAALGFGLHLVRKRNASAEGEPE
ncbi:hypothetical protein [Actinosynnema sp. NPDC023587]|uniref:hypothetical protein n=1 Tax=Actinosynnema sp. NPDC023587 TaxID=3154695 RepID=UPI0033F651E8